MPAKSQAAWRAFAWYAELHAVAPLLGFGGERDQVALAAVGWPGPHAAAIAHDHQTQRGVERAVGLDQFQQLARTCFGILRQRDVQRGGIALDAGPMALEGEQDAIGHAQRAEHSPARKQAHLAGREAQFGRFAECGRCEE